MLLFSSPDLQEATLATARAKTAKEVMQSNLHMALDRGECLDDLVNRSQDLSSSSKAFYQSAKQSGGSLFSFGGSGGSGGLFGFGQGSAPPPAAAPGCGGGSTKLFGQTPAGCAGGSAGLFGQPPAAGFGGGAGGCFGGAPTVACGGGSGGLFGQPPAAAAGFGGGAAGCFGAAPGGFAKFSAMGGDGGGTLAEDRSFLKMLHIVVLCIYWRQ